jgi:SPP1 family predicted phage head-tail adaptor
MRYIPGVMPAMRVNWNGTLYNIKAVLDVEARERLLNLVCDAGLNAG